MPGNGIYENILIPPQTITPGETSSHQKRLRKSSGEDDSLVPSHPLKIKPAGNAYTATENIKLAAGSFTALPDEILIHVLECLDAISLKRLGCACKALYAFSRLEELWKTLCIEYEFSLSDFLERAFCCHNLHLEHCGRGLHCLCRRPARCFQRKGPEWFTVWNYFCAKNVYIIKSQCCSGTSATG